MNAPARTLITVPPQAKRGESITIRALIQHPMENGFRHDERGQRIPRDMIDHFVCHFNGTEVFRADLIGGIAANPLIQFQMTLSESGTLDMLWQGERGEVARASARVEVS